MSALPPCLVALCPCYAGFFGLEMTVPMLKLTDLRKTTRRTNTGSGRTLHPHFLRDRSLVPRIEMAVRYLESMLGKQRSELDQEIITGLFGDHKLARCIVACLAASYRHQPRTFAEVLPPAQVERLGALGITTPSELRLWLFQRANSELPGFVGSLERGLFLQQAGAALGLEAEQIEALMALDTPEQAILARSGPVPTADDVITRFNYSVVAAILANAPTIHLSLATAPRDADMLRQLCELAGVRADLAGREFTLYGQQDALDGWIRHGTRLARLLSALLVCGLPARSGEAIIAAPSGDRWLFRLSAEILGYLGMREGDAGPDFRLADLLACWRAQDALAADYAAVRRAGSDEGWILRRATEPVIAEGAILPTLFLASRGSQRVPLVLAPHTEAGAALLARVAARQPLIALQVGTPATLAGPAARSAFRLLSLIYTVRGDLEQLPLLLAQAVEDAERQSETQQLKAIFDEVYETGLLVEQQLSERLACGLDELSALFARPEVQALAREYNSQYIEGFGLCSAQMLMRARAAVRDVASQRNQAEGSIQLVRALGRRLREVTGASAGIECLIAYLGAA